MAARVGIAISLVRYLGSCFVAVGLAGGMVQGASPVECNYSPPGEYMKDHSIVYHDGWYHLYNISGTAGYYHGYTGNEETVAWSISKDLVGWEFRGHVLHASHREGTFDRHEIWAPFVLKADDGFYMFYTGIIHPTRPMEYRKLGHDHPWVFAGHREAQGLAYSKDLTDWTKLADAEKGLGVPGRDSHVVRDEENGRWLLYSTIGTMQANVSESTDLVHWKSLGICADFSKPDPNFDYGATSEGISDFFHSAESLTVMKHPISGKWIMLGNWQYILSDDPTNFKESPVHVYDIETGDERVDIGFAGEIVEHEGRWYRSGTFGPRDYWKLGFTEIEWVSDGAFRIVTPSVLAKAKNQQ